MAGAFKRSWELTKLSVNVIKADKELIWFPILAGIFSALFVLAMIFPAILSGAVKDVGVSSVWFYPVIFLIYLGLSFIATFFNVCVVYTAKKRFAGKNATFSESISFAASKVHLIFSWSIISATVGLILQALNQIGERMGETGELIMNIVTSLLGAAWAAITVFVVPAMVYDNVGPFKAIKKSISALKKTWGESLIRHYGTGIIQLILIVLGVILTIVLAVLFSAIPALMYAVIVLGILYIIAVIVFFSLINTIFNAALYQFAETGKAPKGFPKEMIEGAFEKKAKPVKSGFI